MATIGRHVSKLSGIASALPTLSEAPTIAASTGLPQRPSPEIISEAIPLFFIGQNENGFWVARESDGQIGGIFLLKTSALRFANRSAQPRGCAIMYLSEPLELDVENKGNPFVARLAPARRIMSQLLDGLRQRQ